MTIAIGIPTYNGSERVGWLLDAIRSRTQDIDYEVIVCDDSGRDSHRQEVKKWCDQWNTRFIYNQHNLGVAASWNRLVQSSDSDLFVLLNDDVIVSKGWLRALSYFLLNNPGAGSASLLCYYLDPKDVPILLADPEAVANPAPGNYGVMGMSSAWNNANTIPRLSLSPLGCLFGFRREHYLKVGGFDSSYFAFYEEWDFGTILACHGLPSYLLATPKCWHMGSQTFSSAPELNSWNWDLIVQSRKFYIEKWAGHVEQTFHRYLSKIPDQQVKWLYHDEPCEALITERKLIL